MTLATLSALWLAVSARPQVRPVYLAIESYVASAKLVCVGKVVGIKDVLVDYRDAVELQIEVSQSLKGPKPKTISALRYGEETRKYFEAAQRAGVEFVWFVPNDAAQICYSLSPEFPSYPSIEALAVGMDFSILRTRQSVLDQIKGFIRENPKSTGQMALLSPLPSGSLTGLVDFVIPISKWTESLALRMITKPESFTFKPAVGNPDDAQLENVWNRSKEGMLRVNGLILLKHFRSNSNIRLAKSCLADTSVAMKQKYGEPILKHFWVREAAFRLLSLWNVSVPQPQLDDGAMASQGGLFSSEPFRLEQVFSRL